jgi:hypothetical protein
VHRWCSVLREAAQCLARQLVETVFAVRRKLLTHAFGPELGDVIGDTSYGILPRRFCAKKVADVIRHLHQVLGAAVSGSAMLRIFAHGKRLFGNEHIGILQQ